MKRAVALRHLQEGSSRTGSWPTSTDIGQGLGAEPAAPPSDVVVHHASEGWFLQPHHLTPNQLWMKIREEASKDASAEPVRGHYHCGLDSMYPNAKTGNLTLTSSPI